MPSLNIQTPSLTPPPQTVQRPLEGKETNTPVSGEPVFTQDVVDRPSHVEEKKNKVL